MVATIFNATIFNATTHQHHPNLQTDLYDDQLLVLRDTKLFAAIQIKGSTILTTMRPNSNTTNSFNLDLHNPNSLAEIINILTSPSII